MTKKLKKHKQKPLPKRDFTVTYDKSLMVNINGKMYFLKCEIMPPQNKIVIILNKELEELEAIRIGLLYYEPTKLDDINTGYFNFFAEYWRFKD